jgi:tetratricopeptide (TPR) repeat protein
MTRNVECPYPGTRPFGRADTDLFFGRSGDSARLAELWQANRLTLAVGPTGSGKTSLLRAGVMPLVENGRQRRGHVLPPGRLTYGSTYPAAALPPHNPYTLGLLRSWSPGEPASRLVGTTVRDFVRQHLECHGGPVLAVVDDIDELLTDPGRRRSQRRAFLEELEEAITEERLHLLLMLRKPALAEFSDALRTGARYEVTPLTFENAVEAVTRPVEGTGRRFAAGGVEELVTSLLNSYITTADGRERYVTAEHLQPALLQVVCARLWASLPDTVPVITPGDVRRYGDTDQALAAYCGRILATVGREYDKPVAQIHSWLLHTFVTDLGLPGDKYEGMTKTAGMPNALVRTLEDRHLLSSERRKNLRWYELLSERLIEPLRMAVAEQPPPADPASYLGSAERAQDMGELALAERHAREALDGSPGGDFQVRAEANSLLGNLACENKKPAEAETHYRAAASLLEAVGDTGGVARHLAAVGQMLLAQGRLAEAAEELRAALGRLPNDRVIQTELGWALWQLGQSRAAESVFSGILAIDAGNAEALRGRGEVLADLGQGRDAMRDLGRLTGQDRPSTRAARGLAMAELGEHAAAGEEIKAALEEAPRNGYVLLYAARAQALGGDPAAAADLAGRAINASDPSLAPHQHAAALQLAGQHEDDG